ncbi:hypothetical protein KGP17_20385 [Serratia sp. JSRIV001]|nr:hypothetical protein KGP17_20385 [Serratia sp. JSRIV001]
MVFLANPIVALFGYIIGVTSGVFGIVQMCRVSKKEKEIISLTRINNALTLENNNLKVNNNTISQGEKSQYFQENNGPVNIDIG